MVSTAPVSGPVESPDPAEPTAGPPSRLQTFHSLKDPSFAWFFASTLGMMSAVMMQMLVRGFLVFEMTGSFAALGVLSLVSAAPQLIFGFYGGVLADRFPKKSVAQVGQTIGFANVLAMGLLAAFGLLEFWHLLVSGIGSGLLIGMMMPARQAMVHEVVKGDRMLNAVSLNTAGMNLMQIAAPAVGGIVLKAWGAEGAFFLMTACYGSAIVTMSFVPGSPAAQKGDKSARAAVADVMDGLRYVRGHKELRQILLFSFVIAFLGSAYMPVLPGFVAEVFSENASVLGLLIAISAIGALAGSLVLASLPDRYRGLLLIASAIALGLGLIGLSFSPEVWIAAPFMVAIGLGQSGRQSIGNTLILVYSDAAHRGRVTSIFMLQFAVMSVGGFAIGIMASAVAIEWAFGTISIALVIVSVAALFSSRTLREIQ